MSERRCSAVDHALHGLGVALADDLDLRGSVVEQVGDAVTDLQPGDFVIAPFTVSDGTCPACRHGYQSNCEHGGAFGNGDTDGGQGQYVRAPYADATLVKVPGSGFTDEQLA